LIGKIIVVGVGGFVGANARYGLALWVGERAFPWATLATNAIGCFGLALFITLLTQRGALSEEARLLVATGFFGAFTTFSTFNLEAITLMQKGQGSTAILYMVASFGLCMVGGLIGVQLGNWF
jgi:fluoride exporter